MCSGFWFLFWFCFSWKLSSSDFTSWFFDFWFIFSRSEHATIRHYRKMNPPASVRWWSLSCKDVPLRWHGFVPRYSFSFVLAFYFLFFLTFSVWFPRKFKQNRFISFRYGCNRCSHTTHSATLLSWISLILSCFVINFFFSATKQEDWKFGSDSKVFVKVKIKMVVDVVVVMWFLFSY